MIQVIYTCACNDARVVFFKGVATGPARPQRHTDIGVSIKLIALNDSLGYGIINTHLNCPSTAILLF